VDAYEFAENDRQYAPCRVGRQGARFILPLPSSLRVQTDTVLQGDSQRFRLSLPLLWNIGIVLS